jgi:hypothetical protein
MLTAHYQPRVISTDAEDDEVIAQCHELEYCSERTPEEELLSVAIVQH